MTTYKALSFGGMALAASVVCAAIVTTPNEAQACGVEPYIGSVCYTAATYCPDGWLLANGAKVAIQGNEPLYALLGTVYGGDGRTEFNLPDLRGRFAMGAGQGVGLLARARGQKVGTEGVVLGTAAMPAHTHVATFTGTVSPVSITATVQASTTIGTSAMPSTATPTLGGAQTQSLSTRKIWSATQAASPITVGGTSVTVSALPPGTGGGPTIVNSSTGSGTAFANASPQLTLLPCVATQGIYPTQ